MSGFINLSRRGFLEGSGALVLGFALPGYKASVEDPDPYLRLGAAADGSGHHFNAWIRIADDGLVTLRMGAAEMGQGVFTALPMILAEELDVRWEDVQTEVAPVHKDYNRKSYELPGERQLTGGSESVRGYWEYLRKAGATARAMLVEAASDRWDVDPRGCRTEDGHVLHGEQRLGYGELAAEAASIRPPRRVKLKDPADFRLLGTTPQRLDIPPKTDGTATFGIDVQMEGLLNATVRACPHHGGSLLAFDDAAARAIPGVVDVFAVEDVVVVVADTFWHAKKASLALDVTWDPGKGAGLDDDEIHRRLQEGIDRGGSRVSGHGRKPAAGTIQATYEVPYLDHAPIEPLNGTVWVQDKRVDIWAPTQAQTSVRNRAARATGMPKSRVFVHTTFVGGGFGRKSIFDFTDLAVEIGKRVRKPVKMTWTREECFARGYYRPGVLCHQGAELGEDGLPTDWYVKMAGQNPITAILPPSFGTIGIVVTGGMSHAPYAIDRQRVDYRFVNLPIKVGWWRSVQHSYTGFMRECFIDELAHAAGQDPIDYRRKLLADNPRYLACFNLAVEKAGAVPEGLSRGVALMFSFGSLVAMVADLAVVDGDVQVARITAAIDCGLVVHPDIIRAQVMSAAGMGLSSALHEGITWKDGAAQQSNFHQYPLLKMARMPEVDVHIVKSSEPPGGVGEPGLPPAVGAVCNAIFAATGKRIRKLPIGDQLEG